MKLYTGGTIATFPVQLGSFVIQVRSMSAFLYGQFENACWYIHSHGKLELVKIHSEVINQPSRRLLTESGVVVCIVVGWWPGGLPMNGHYSR